MMTTVERTTRPVSSGVWSDGQTMSTIERVSELHRLRLEEALQVVPLLPRTDELVSPGGTAHCWLGGFAAVAARHTLSWITLVPPDSHGGEAHFLVDGQPLPDQHDQPLQDAMTAWYGIDLWSITVEPAAVGGWLGEEIAAALESARHHPVHRKAFAVYAYQARLDGGWTLSALSDVGVAGWTLAALCRELLALEPLAVPA